MKLLIYMPALNEEDSLGGVIKDLPKKIDGMNKLYKQQIIKSGKIPRGIGK